MATATRTTTILAILRDRVETAGRAAEDARAARDQASAAFIAHPSIAHRDRTEWLQTELDGAIARHLEASACLDAVERAVRGARGLSPPQRPCAPRQVRTEPTTEGER